jgi:hypothetical protein
MACRKIDAQNSWIVVEESNAQIRLSQMTFECLHRIVEPKMDSPSLLLSKGKQAIGRTLMLDRELVALTDTKRTTLVPGRTVSSRRISAARRGRHTTDVAFFFGVGKDIHAATHAHKAMS